MSTPARSWTLSSRANPYPFAAVEDNKALWTVSRAAAVFLFLRCSVRIAGLLARLASRRASVSIGNFSWDRSMNQLCVH